VPRLRLLAAAQVDGVRQPPRPARPVQAPPLPEREPANLADEVLGWLCQVPRMVAERGHHA
jgi:hypothetical protein